VDGSQRARWVVDRATKSQAVPKWQVQVLFKRVRRDESGVGRRVNSAIMYASDDPGDQKGRAKRDGNEAPDEDQRSEKSERGNIAYLCRLREGSGRENRTFNNPPHTQTHRGRYQEKGSPIGRKRKYSSGAGRAERRTRNQFLAKGQCPRLLDLSGARSLQEGFLKRRFLEGERDTWDDAWVGWRRVRGKMGETSWDERLFFFLTAKHQIGVPLTGFPVLSWPNGIPDTGQYLRTSTCVLGRVHSW
jgi:hypothetical protein